MQAWDRQGVFNNMLAWIQDNRPASTRLTYTRYAKQYLKWAGDFGADYRCPITVVSFLRCFYEERGCAQSTIVVVKSAIADIFRYAEMQKPTSSTLVNDTITTIKRLAPAPTPKKPLLMSQVKQMYALRGESLKDVRDYFLVLLMMVGIMRGEEAVNLKSEDVWLEEVETRSGREKVLFVFIEKSKTDQFRHGHTVILSSFQEDRSVCPVLQYAIYRFMRDLDAKYFFHHIATKDQNKRLAPATTRQIVKERLVQIGVDPDGYGSHSCRRGGATAAFNQGVNILLVKRHGNWKSDAVFRYMVEDVQGRLAVSQAILSS